MGTQEFKDDALPSKKELQRVDSPFDFNFDTPSNKGTPGDGVQDRDNLRNSGFGRRVSAFREESIKKQGRDLDLSEELKHDRLASENNAHSGDPMKGTFGDKRIVDADNTYKESNAKLM